MKNLSNISESIANLLVNAESIKANTIIRASKTKERAEVIAKRKQAKDNWIASLVERKAKLDATVLTQVKINEDITKLNDILGETKLSGKFAITLRKAVKELNWNQVRIDRETEFLNKLFSKYPEAVVVTK